MPVNWKSLIFPALAATLCSCAQSAQNMVSVAPENVAPAYVNHVPYMGFSCAKLEQNQVLIAQDLQEASQKSSDQRTGPIIARLKGETEAVKKALIAKKCSQTAEAKRS